MLTSLTLPALAFVMAISGIPGLNALPGLKGLAHHKPKPTAADSLPPPWKSASRLAVEHDFLRPGLPPLGTTEGLKITSMLDPRRIRVRVDPDSGVYANDIEVGEQRMGPGYRASLIGFGTTSMRRTFATRWKDRSRQNVNSLGANTPAAHSGLQLKLPVALPTPIQSLLGPGGPALNVSGAENIRISGTSNWTNQQTGLLGAKRSLFPSLDMQQDLDIRLEGQLSDRVKVNLLQNSANQVPLANRIAINYRGDEDDLVQALDLGNTSLSLPGTQYVSYSGRNEGLFGVKLSTRFGPLDFTALASKQEGRSERASYAGSSSTAPDTKADYDYVKGQYFLLYDPNFGSIYQIDDTSIQLYLDDGNYGNDINTVLGRAVLDPDRVMLGDYFVGRPPDTAGVRGSFDKKFPGPTADYEILPDYYLFRGFAFKIIRLKQPIPPDSKACLAVTYTAQQVDLTGGPIGSPIQVGGRTIIDAGPDSARVLMKILRVPRTLQATINRFYDPNGAFEPVRELELKNFYQLGYGIDPQSFHLSIQKGRDEPAQHYAKVDTSLVNYIEAVGLDNVNESTTPALPGHDEKVDGTLNTGSQLQSTSRYFVDYKNGILFLPDPRPFAPRVAVADSHFFDQLMNSALNRRVLLVGSDTASNAANPNIYNKVEFDGLDAKYYITMEYAAQRTGGDILLGKGTILEGSEVVTVNGERWNRDRDYTIDYDIGRISLKRQLGPTDQLNIDYSYAPLFQQASKTLLGSAFRLEGRDRSLGGAFLYESKGAQDLRPRIGEEPSRSLITDLNSEWRFRPEMLTRFVDKLPGVRTSTPSELNVQAEVGASFPNPNTRNEVYLDDMEGVRDAVSLSMSPDHWRYMSVPKLPTTILNGVATVTKSLLADTLAGQHNAEIHWYVPPNVVKERDLKPNLTDAQGGRNPRQALALSVPRIPRTSRPGDKLWTGLTYPLDQVGLDLSRAQFIELWVNDFRDMHNGVDSVARIRGAHAKLHIDLGVVSEDQMRAPNRPPDSFLQSEDQKPRDRQLVVAGDRDEDTGLDGLLDKDGAERNTGLPMADLSTASDLDWEGDDYGDPDDSFKDLDPRKFTRTNGSEGNKKLYPYPETEDLDLNELVDQDETYFEYTVDLDGTSPYLMTDVWRDFGLTLNLPVAQDNGWRRYRIPITDQLRVQFGIPDLSIARHVRVWLEDLVTCNDTTAAEQKPLLLLGGLDIVGNRWFESALTPRQRDTLGTTVTLNSVNTFDNAGVYVAPFDPGETRSGSEAVNRRETSMALEFTELAPGDTVEAYKTFSLEENYSRYGALRWYATGFDIAGYNNSPGDSLFYFVRFSTDERGDNFYEIKRHLPASVVDQVQWEYPTADIAGIANLKLNGDFPQVAPFLYRAAYGDAGDSIIIKGRPSFTRLRRVSFGLINGSDASQGGGRTYSQGQLWFDEIRATNVAKDVGYANRLLVSGRLANLMTYNVSWNSRDENFLSVGETRGSGSRSTNLALTSSMDVHRFFEGTGIQLPVTATYAKNSMKPLFSAGDDVIRTGIQQKLSETATETRSVSTSYSRAWSQRANPLLRYTLAGVTATMSGSQTDARTPTGGGRSTGTSAGVNWSVSPRSLLAIGSKRVPFKFYPLPERVYWNYQVQSNSSDNFTLAQDGSGRRIPSASTNGRTAGLDFGADTRPFDMLTHHIQGHRALSLSGVPLDRVGFINFGRLTTWQQSFTGSWSLQRGSPWLRPIARWGSNYYQANDVNSENLSLRSISNGQNLSLSWMLPLDQLRGGGMAPPRTPSPADTGTAAVKKRPSGAFLNGMLSRLGSLQMDGTLNRTSSYSRLLGMPSPLYALGLAENPGLGAGAGNRMQAVNGNTTLTGLDWRTNASTRVPFVYGSAVSLRASYGDRTGVSNGIVTRLRDRRLPDLDVDYGKLPEALKLTKLLKNPQLRTAWSWSRSWDYQGSRSVQSGTSSTHDLHPLFALRGSLKNGTTADLGINMRSTYREVTTFGRSVQRDNNTDLNFTLSRAYSQGQKVNLLGKTSTVRSSVNLSLATVYSQHKAETRMAGLLPQNQSDDTRLSVTGKGTYGFSTNVTGSAVLGYSGSSNRLQKIQRRSIRVELSAQFTF